MQTPPRSSYKDTLLPELARLSHQYKSALLPQNPSTDRTNNLVVQPYSTEVKRSGSTSVFRDAFKARMYEPDKTFKFPRAPDKNTTSNRANASISVGGDNSNSKPPVTHNLSSASANKLNFVLTHLKLLHFYCIDNGIDTSVVTRLSEVTSFVVGFSNTINKETGHLKREVQSLNQALSKLQESNDAMTKENYELKEYIKNLEKFQKGVSQRRLAYENDKLRLQNQKIVEILTEKEKCIQSLKETIQKNEQTIKELEECKESLNAFNKVKEELSLYKHTMEHNMAERLKYIFN